MVIEVDRAIRCNWNIVTNSLSNIQLDPHLCKPQNRHGWPHASWPGGRCWAGHTPQQCIKINLKLWSLPVPNAFPRVVATFNDGSPTIHIMVRP